MYRRLTLSLCTADEHPLRIEDIAAARCHFASVDSDPFGLRALAAITLRGRPGFERAAERLQRADRVPSSARRISSASTAPDRI